jgi:hypothetical protein
MGKIWERVWLLGMKAQWLEMCMKDAEVKLKQLEKKNQWTAQIKSLYLK